MLSKQPDPAGKPIVCDRSHRSYDWCHLKLRTILEPTSATFFTVGSPAAAVLPLSWEKIRPYPRKTDSKTMSNIREITLTTAPLHTPCEVHHNTPALVFSTGGFTGNFFHDFNDGIIPLFVTINTLFPHDRDITIVVANYADWWHSKYAAILPQFSSRPIINLNNQTVTHCFPSAVAGLISHGSMTINPTLIPNGKTFHDFRALLEEGYRRCLVWPPPRLKGRPRLVLVTRAGTVGRVLMNRDNIVRAAQEAGFDVVVLEPSPLTYLCDIYRLINGSHAMVGVHGAALTHSLFLQPGSVLVQVVPLGNDWLAGTYFKNLARGLNLVYMEYKIRAEESSLVEKYGADHVLVKDSLSIARRNWTALHDVYLKGQDVRVDVGRFRRCLRNAYSNAKRLMQAQGFHVRHRPRIRKYVSPLVFS
ncbi:hypothetical protein Nepgr_003611 [Nepenthes gracilis]|uniref:Glycosyltransferase 61 catalytic domain-containing protein n=1 Tax=Nepenthes gracilis TaxID=150966 RepID=A0AAD3RZY3_NEPGR|nr:hypothetical protein Nepgr_003611 [Nepenthes gracilis]